MAEANNNNNDSNNDNSPVHPFAVTADTLHSLFSPYKNHALARELGGGLGLCRALCVDPATGLADPATAATPPPEHTNAAADSPPPPASAAASTNLLSDTSSASASNTDTNAADPITTTTTVCVAAALENGADLELRRRVFGENRMPPQKVKTLWEIIVDGMRDRMLQLLCVAAALTMIFGIVETAIANSREKKDSSSSSHEKSGDGGSPLYEGLAIICTVLLVIAVGSLTEWKKVKTFETLSNAKDDITFTVLRDGHPCTISTFDILVGDIFLVQTGDIMPCDAVVISASSLRCDESSATGESDLIRKSADPEGDPLLLSGSKVVEGTATAVVTCVGPLSFYGSIMVSLRREPRLTPLQEQLNSLANKIAILGMVAAAIMLVICLVFVGIEISKMVKAGITDKTDFAINTVIIFVRAFEAAVSIIVVAVPEGLPVAVTSALCLAAYRMMKENNFVRELASCEVMANATTICSDKTGTLTQNRMAVVRASFGGILRKINSAEEASSLRRVVDNPEYYDLLNNAVSVNSTAFLDKDEKTGADVFVGSKTEVALLDMARTAGSDVIAIRSAAKIIHSYPFSSETKWMGTIVELHNSTETSPRYRLYVKGASEIVLRACKNVHRLAAPAACQEAEPLSPSKSPISMVSQDDHEQASQNNAGVFEMSVDMRAALENTIEAYARASLRTIIAAYRDFDELPENYETSGASMLSKLTHLALFGIEDPLRPGVVEAVTICNRAGVFVRMVTGDNINTARAIATQAGILRGGVAMEGRVFRKLSEVERMKMLPRLQVLARSSPEDKQLLVQSLRDMGEVVAVTGDGTNDAPALRMADVGFSMYLSGTKVAVDASAIALLDDNFSSIVTAILWGRNVNGAVKKFLQFQLSVNVSSVIIAFVAKGCQVEVMNVMQMLWINVIMDTGAAIAYVSERPSRKLLKQSPEPRDAPLISTRMLRIIASTAILQIILLVVLIVGFKPESYNQFIPTKNLPDAGSEGYTEKLASMNALAKNTFAFNAFVFLQIFSEINSRNLDRRLNVFHGLHRSPCFVTVLLITAAMQAILVYVASSLFKLTPLTAHGFFLSALLGVFPIFSGFLVRVVPETWFACCCPKPPPKRVAMTRGRLQWQAAISKVRTQLAVYRALRGDVVVDRAVGGTEQTLSLQNHRLSRTLSKANNLETTD